MLACRTFSICQLLPSFALSLHRKLLRLARNTNSILALPCRIFLCAGMAITLPTNFRGGIIPDLYRLWRVSHTKNTSSPSCAMKNSTSKDLIAKLFTFQDRTFSATLRFSSFLRALWPSLIFALSISPSFNHSASPLDSSAPSFVGDDAVVTRLRLEIMPCVLVVIGVLLFGCKTYYRSNSACPFGVRICGLEVCMAVRYLL